MSVRIVVCAKEVLDPDAVNNYALEGKLVIGDDGKSLTQSSIPRLMNAYDEQAIEAALRLGSTITAWRGCSPPSSSRAAARTSCSAAVRRPTTIKASCRRSSASISGCRS